MPTSAVNVSDDMELQIEESPELSLFVCGKEEDPLP